MNRIRHSAAFTLVELLAVVAVIAVVIVFAVPAANQIIKGSQLTQASQLVSDQLSFARQRALSRNRTVELRFYRFGDPETPGEDISDPKKGRWRGMQLFELMENGAAVPVGTFQRLPRMTALSPADTAVPQNKRYSTLLDEDLRGTYVDADKDPTAPEIPIEINGRKVAKNYQWVAIQFRPDGSTNLAPWATRAKAGGGSDQNNNDTWYVTVLNLADIERQAELKDINYSTIQLDPFTGAQKTFRPTVGSKPKTGGT